MLKKGDEYLMNEKKLQEEYTKEIIENVSESERLAMAINLMKFNLKLEDIFEVTCIDIKKLSKLKG